MCLCSGPHIGHDSFGKSLEVLASLGSSSSPVGPLNYNFFEVKAPRGKVNNSVNKLFIFLSLFVIIAFIDFVPY